jgi:hypothetical protein
MRRTLGWIAIAMSVGCGVAEEDEAGLDGDVGTMVMDLDASSCPVTPFIDKIAVAFVHRQTGEATFVVRDRVAIDADCALQSDPNDVDTPFLEATLRPGRYDVHVWSQDQDGIVNSEPASFADQQLNANDTRVFSVRLMGARANGAVFVSIDNGSY